MMHESKGHILAKPHPYIFFTLQLVLASYLIATYKAHIPIQLMPMHTLLDNTLLGHVGGGKWPGDRVKTMPCTFMTLS